MPGHAEGRRHYKADGTSNYYDPLFAESDKFFLIWQHPQYPIDYLTRRARSSVRQLYERQLAMNVSGCWVTTWLPTEEMPRD
jgi:hypothetical protein